MALLYQVAAILKLSKTPLHLRFLKPSPIKNHLHEKQIFIPTPMQSYHLHIYESRFGPGGQDREF